MVTPEPSHSERIDHESQSYIGVTHMPAGTDLNLLNIRTLKKTHTWDKTVSRVLCAQLKGTRVSMAITFLFSKNIPKTTPDYKDFSIANTCTYSLTAQETY